MLFKNILFYLVPDIEFKIMFVNIVTLTFMNIKISMYLKLNTKTSKHRPFLSKSADVNVKTIITHIYD